MPQAGQGRAAPLVMLQGSLIFPAAIAFCACRQACHLRALGACQRSSMPAYCHAWLMLPCLSACCRSATAGALVLQGASDPADAGTEYQFNARAQSAAAEAELKWSLRLCFKGDKGINCRLW